MIKRKLNKGIYRVKVDFARGGVGLREDEMKILKGLLKR